MVMVVNQGIWRIRKNDETCLPRNKTGAKQEIDDDSCDSNVLKGNKETNHAKCISQSNILVFKLINGLRPYRQSMAGSLITSQPLISVDATFHEATVGVNPPQR